MDRGYYGRGYPGARVIAEIHALAELIEAEIKGLRAPEHARALEPIVRKVTRLMARYFRRQERLMVSAVTMKEAEADAKNLDTSNISLTYGELGCVDGNGHESDNGIHEFLIALGELASKKKITDPLLQPLIDDYTELVGDDDTE